MAKFDGFEDIDAWKKAYSIRRATVSIMANIAEGHGRKSNLEFANFLNIARGSAHEVQSHLYIAVGLNYIDRPDFDQLYAMLGEVSRMTLGLARYLRENDRK